MNVHWTEAALADLRGIEAYIALHSERYARAMIDRILRRTEVLAQFPQIGPAVPEYEDESLRELFEHPYRIVYRVLETQVDVVAVVHAARRMLKGL
jgi:plasmid stabilization system protein ParE